MPSTLPVLLILWRGRVQPAKQKIVLATSLFPSTSLIMTYWRSK